jgi:hypothetical protein
MPNAVARSLAAELAAMGFMPNPLRAKLVGSRMADRGEQEFTCLRKESAALDSFRTVCAHYLGTGASLTEFLISGLTLDREVKSQIATLGGIANTIIGVFDKLLDDSQCVPVLFGDNPQLSADSEICGKQKLVLDLVDLYFRKLDSLNATALRVRALLELAIRRFYQAELGTAANALSWSAWWRKNALLTVIMGLPAWLHMRDSDHFRFREHLMWLSRVGEFLGWLDDAADYESDAAAGSANWLLLWHESSINNRIGRIAAKGQRVLRFWDARNADSPARDTFMVIAWMWLNAP